MTSRPPPNAEDTCAEIVALLTERIPGSDPDRLHTQIAALGLLPANARRLLTYLSEHPGALTAGDPAGPAVLRTLLDLLAAEHPSVRRVHCHRCGKVRTLPYRDDGAGICRSCYNKTRLTTCVQCGELGIPTVREPGGTICSRCAARDPNRIHTCHICGKAARIYYRVDGNPVCQNCGPRKLHTCSSCGRENTPAHALTEHGPLCSRCYHRGRVHQCCECGQETEYARRVTETMDAWICYRCWVPPTRTCSVCGADKPCGRKTSGKPICSTCRARRQQKRRCVQCSRTVKIQTTLPIGAICGSCYRHLRRTPAPCAGCGQSRPLVGIDTHGNRICGPCSGDCRNWRCRHCGIVGLLIENTFCLSCSVESRVRDLLTGPGGRVHPQLASVATFLLDETPRERSHQLLNRAQWVTLLRSLVESGDPITHASLDRLKQGTHVRHLRTVLVYTGVLDDRSHDLDAVDAWIDELLDGLPRDIALLLRPYAAWSVLHRARHRAQGGGAHPPAAGSVSRYARARITAAAQFLTWLTDHDRDLAGARQADVDRWLDDGTTTRWRLRDFLLWANSHHLTADLHVPSLGREGLPQHILGDDQRWALLRRCLRDPNLDLTLRVAGALLLLYAQIPTHIVELTADDVVTDDTGMHLILHTVPVLIPPPLASLVAELLEENEQQPRQQPPDAPVWLFPGYRPGTHFSGSRLSTNLNKTAGIFTKPARGAALCALAADLPAPVLADLLGVSVAAATRWSALAGRDNAEYLAARIDNPPE